jgi:Fe-S-cluster containining protein
VTRDDFERALRSLHLSDFDLRDMLLRLAAQVVALTEATGVSVDDATAAAFTKIRAADARTGGRVWLGTELDDKYEVAGATPPCEELMPICKARCCKLSFALSTADLDEGVIRWDYGQPYRIRQRASDGYCVHNDPGSGGCTVHTHRPAICRRYDCRNDTRIWADYDARIPAPPDHPGDGADGHFDLMDRVRLRALGEVLEHNAIGRTFPDDEPREGPPATPRPPRRSR